MSADIEIKKLLTQGNEKRTYYVIALCVTAIGFSVITTIDSSLSLSQIPLLLSIICWGFSIFCGMELTKLSLKHLWANAKYFEISADYNNNPEVNKILLKLGKKKASEGEVNASQYKRNQERLFYIGIILFITWHILEMYLRTVCLTNA
jgi:hypothetical protein